MCSPGTATEAGELSRGGKSVILPQHLIGDHLGLDDVGHGSPHLDGLHARLLSLPEGQQLALHLGKNQQIFACQLGAGVDEVENYIPFIAYILQQNFI